MVNWYMVVVGVSGKHVPKWEKNMVNWYMVVVGVSGKHVPKNE